MGTRKTGQETRRQIKKDVILFTLTTIACGFFLGWLFPVEGPVDYVYDNYKARRCPVKAAPRQPEEKKLTQEELDFIYELLYGEGEESAE